MLGMIRSKVTYANVMATIAMFIALGGGAYAATTLKPNSVGTKQIKKAAVTNAKLGKNAVTGAKVKDGSLTGSDLNLATLPKVSSAGTADNASHAANADHAGNSDSAAHATSADNATHASTADDASHASTSDQLGGVAANRYVTNDSSLASGQTETGYFTASAPSGSFAMVQINFIPKAPTPVPLANVHLLAAGTSSAPNCSGTGHAAPGHVCIYEGWRFSVTFSCFAGVAACSGTTTDRNGFGIYYDSSNAQGNVTGTWAYTAP